MQGDECDCPARHTGHCADARPERSELQAFIAQYLAYKVYGHHFYSLSHNLLHLVAAGWMASFLADHVCAVVPPIAPAHALRVARLVHDPAVMVCLVVLMIGHQHDTTPIGEFFHDHLFQKRRPCMRVPWAQTRIARQRRAFLVNFALSSPPTTLTLSANWLIARGALNERFPVT